MKRAPYVVFFLAAVVFFAGMSMLFDREIASGSVYPEYSSLRSDPDGAKLLYDSLARLPGITVDRSFMSLAGSSETKAAILEAGVTWSFVLAAVTLRRSDRPAKAYLVLRQAFGGTLLLGLEVLVAADLLRTVAVAPTLDNVLVLGLIVAIRTFLSFSLETEIEGVAPWRRALISGAGTIRRASASALEPETPP